MNQGSARSASPLCTLREVPQLLAVNWGSGIVVEITLAHLYNDLKWEHCTCYHNGTVLYMRVVAKKTLREFWARFPDAEQPLLAWYREVVNENWSQPADVKAKYKSVSVLKSGRLVFNIKGNDYRLIVKVHYNTKVVFVRFVGTHVEYDAIDAEQV